MPSNQYPSSLTYPSDSGSDVHRSASFWLAPSTVSSPACAGQPAKNQHTSDGKGDSPKPRTECPAPEGKTEILKGMDKRQVQSLYSRLCAMGDACGMWSRVLAKSELVCAPSLSPFLSSRSQSNTPSAERAKPYRRGDLCYDRSGTLRRDCGR